MDRVGVVVHRGPALGHAGVHEGGHHHPAGVEAQHVGGVVAPLGVAGARAGRVAGLPVLHLVHLLLQKEEDTEGSRQDIGYEQSIGRGVPFSVNMLLILNGHFRGCPLKK